MKRIIGLLVAGVLAVGALVAAPAITPATTNADGGAASSALSLVSPDSAHAAKKKHKKKKAKHKKHKKKASKGKAKATRGEYKKIKRGMSLAKVRKIIGSKGKRTWYYEDTYSDTKCDDGYYVDGYNEQTEVWNDGYWDSTWVEGDYDENGDWVEGYYDDIWVDGDITYEDTWVDGYWVDGECWDEDLTTVYKDYSWKNNKGGYVYVSFENGKVTSKSWYS